MDVQKRRGDSTSFRNFDNPIGRKRSTRKGLDRKGQVTIFIIIGIVILFTFAGVTYVTKKVVKEKVTAEGEPVIAQVPQEFQPIQTYTENCLSQVGIKGLHILGQQGGYLYPELVGTYSATNPTDADGLNLEPLKVPYWHYNVKPNAELVVQFATLQPKLYNKEDPVLSIEAQLSRFVEEKLADCLQEYAPFTQQGFTVELPEQSEEIGGREVQVIIGDNTVNFWLEMPLTARRGTAEQKMEQFYVKVPLELKKYYETAAELADVERTASFIERQALDLISSYGGVAVDKLPPMEAMTFDLIPTVYWSEAEIKERMKGLLVSYVPVLRYLASRDFYRFDYRKGAVAELSDLHQKNYDNTIIPLEKGSGLEVSFDYFGWELYFDANDKSGQIGPSSTPVNYYALQFATQHYYTTYDLSYPVLITIRDPAALKGEGFTFLFALEATIRNNEIPRSGEVLPPPIVALGKSMVCDKRNTELIKTVVVDSFTKEPLEAVQIGFSVPEQGDCVMGLTDAHGGLAVKYPAVYGGVGSVVKAEYLTNFYPLDTYHYKETPGVIGYAVAGWTEKVMEMHKLRTIKVDVKKKNLEKCVGVKCTTQGLFGGEELYSYTPTILKEKHRWVFSNSVQNLNEKEDATIMLRRVGDLNPFVLGDELMASAQLKGKAEAEVQLVPGLYEVTGLVTSTEPVAIPKGERCTSGITEAVACFDVDGCCFTFQEQVLDSLLVGQVSWDTPKTYVKITPEQLYGSDKITFYVLGFDEKNVPADQRVLEDLQVMGQLGNLSQQVRKELEPSFT
ncbi:hypothetical protein HYX14_05740 [Candidatus Woesearchaeota archaeon]|nr:hypothetical protein [Candidatus Woesearchaeota archaeon]